MINEEPKRTPIPEAIDHHIQFVGGTTAATKTVGGGQGVTVTYVSTGLVNLVWADNPGLFICAGATFQATVPAALAGFTVVFGAYNATTFTLPVNIYNDGSGTPVLTDLTALQWCNIDVTFKRSGSGV